MRPFLPIKHRRRLPLPAAVIVFFLCGCASYQPEPLPTRPDLAAHAAQLVTPATTPGIHPEQGLTLTEAAILAVRNNPDLKAVRKRLGVARAELFSTGLLPDPQLSANLDYPTGSAPGTVNAFGVGLNYDIIPLINRGARLDSARQAERQARLELLWQEWQVSQQARSLAAQMVGQRREIVLLHEMRALYRQRYRHSRKAVAQGDLTMDVAGTDLTALLDTLSQIHQLEQTRNDTRHTLSLLMGLTPGTQLKIRLPPLPELPAAQTLNREIETLPRRRPDLLALQAGYQSQEAKVRAAVLSQFPAFNIGITRARDTGGVYTAGFSIGIDLPLFSAGRGVIAVARATREQLLEEYQARLDQVAVDVKKLIRLQGIVAAQQKQLDEYLPTLEKLVVRGREAYRRGDIDALTFLNMENTWVTKRLEQIGLEQTQRENLIALQTLLAMPEDGMPRADHVSRGDKP